MRQQSRYEATRLVAGAKNLPDEHVGAVHALVLVRRRWGQFPCLLTDGHFAWRQREHPRVL